MAYSNNWNASDQVALRAITTGQIGPYGELDPSDGGVSSRFALSGRMAQTTDDGSWKANAYIMKYNLDLFSDFSWDTNDPVNKDQFHQHDDRVYGGGGISRTINGSLFNLPTETVVGLQGRDDDINIGLSSTTQRLFLSNTLFDHVNEGNAAIYGENTVHWTNWLRTVVGWRGDYYAASVNSMLQPANSGNPKEAIGSPKFRMVLGPFAKTEFFVGAGMGYHSNDARGTVTTDVPGDPTTPQGQTPFLVRSRGAEVGVRTKAIPDLDSSISLFYIHQDLELFFDGDGMNYDSWTAEPAYRHRVHQRLPASVVGSYRRRPRALSCTVSRIRRHAGCALPVARWLSAGATRQRAGQLRLQRTLDDRFGRHYARREDRLVQRTALALHQFAAADRRWSPVMALAQHPNNSRPASAPHYSAPRQQSRPQFSKPSASRPQNYGGRSYGGQLQRPQNTMRDNPGYRQPQMNPQAGGRAVYPNNVPYRSQVYPRAGSPAYAQPGYAARPNNLQPNYAPPGHLGAWLNEHHDATVQDQERMLRSDPSFTRLPQGDQQRLVQQLHQVDQMPKQQRERRLARAEALERLSPQDRAQVNNSARRWTSLATRSPGCHAERLSRSARRAARSAPHGAQLRPLPGPVQPRRARHSVRHAARRAVPVAAVTRSLNPAKIQRASSSGAFNRMSRTTRLPESQTFPAPLPSLCLRAPVGERRRGPA